ncbi:MAG: hypothetical protein LBG80_16005 [Bacteroidales bacterium]|nr:hypothetical protein [Bacteroidales bacterium]
MSFTNPLSFTIRSNQHLINWDWDIDYSSFGQFIYNSTFPYGFRGGYVKDWTGFYFGTLRTKTDARLNLSGGLIGCVSSLFHVYAGVGAGFIGNIGMNVEGGVTINIRKIPISVGIKACDIKNSNRYLTFDFAIGWYDEDRTPSQIKTYYQKISFPPN